MAPTHWQHIRTAWSRQSRRSHPGAIALAGEYPTARILAATALGIEASPWLRLATDAACQDDAPHWERLPYHLFPTMADLTRLPRPLLAIDVEAAYLRRLASSASFSRLTVSHPELAPEDVSDDFGALVAQLGRMATHRAPEVSLEANEGLESLQKDCAAAVLKSADALLEVVVGVTQRERNKTAEDATEDSAVVGAASVVSDAAVVGAASVESARTERAWG